MNGTRCGYSTPVPIYLRSVSEASSIEWKQSFFIIQFQSVWNFLEILEKYVVQRKPRIESFATKSISAP